MTFIPTVATGLWSLLVVASMHIGPAGAQTPSHSVTHQGDLRELVALPPPMHMHMLSNMRDHLSTLQQIDEALSRNDFTSAATIAETRLGLSSLEAHDAAHLAPFMPKPMQALGTEMHRAASRFAVEAQDASASNDIRRPLAALATVMQQCVACHAAYRLR